MLDIPEADIPESETDTGDSDGDTPNRETARLSDEDAVNILAKPFDIVAGLRNKDYWKLTKEEIKTLKATIGSVREKFNIDRYLKDVGCIGFGLTLFWIGLSRILKDIRGEKEESEDMAEASTVEELREIEQDIKSLEGAPVHDIKKKLKEC